MRQYLFQRGFVFMTMFVGCFLTVAGCNGC